METFPVVDYTVLVIKIESMLNAAVVDVVHGILYT